MVEIEVHYEGSLHTHCVHGPSQAVAETDAPRDNHGRGESYSPTDLVATALGSCMLTVMGIVARNHDWKLDGSRARIEKHMVEEPTRRIGRIVVDMAMASGLPADSRTVLENAARTCPVAESIHPGIDVDLRFDWPESR